MAFRVIAPGRANLIGEHTDYTGGFALPMAVELGITAVGSERHDTTVRANSDQLDGEVIFDLGVDPYPASAPRWGRLLHAVARELVERGHATQGMDCTFSSTLPPDSGMSSSAAFSVASTLALGGQRDPIETAHIARSAEHRATGVPCGIMDQIASAGAVGGHAILLDCGDESYRHIAVPPAWSFLVVHSGRRRRLEDSGYAQRVDECAEVERSIGPLREATIVDLENVANSRLRRRARHVIGENARVAAFAECLTDDDITTAGGLMSASHRSLRDDFEVSTTALDGLVDLLDRQPGVHGTRLMGAGFGGCTISLCDRGAGTIPAGFEGWRIHPSQGATISWEPPGNRA